MKGIYFFRKKNLFVGFLFTFFFSTTLFAQIKSADKYSPSFQSTISANSGEIINLFEKLNLIPSENHQYEFYNSQNQTIENPRTYKIEFKEGLYDYLVKIISQKDKQAKNLKFSLSVQAANSPKTSKRIKRGLSNLKESISIAIASLCLRRRRSSIPTAELVNFCPPEEEIELAEEATESPSIFQGIQEQEREAGPDKTMLAEGLSVAEVLDAVQSTPEPIAGPSELRSNPNLMRFTQEVNQFARNSRRLSSDSESLSLSQIQENLVGQDMNYQLDDLATDFESNDFSLEEESSEALTRSNPIAIESSASDIDYNLNPIVGSPPRNSAPIHQVNFLDGGIEDESEPQVPQMNLHDLELAEPNQGDSSQDEGIGEEEDFLVDQSNQFTTPHMEFKREIKTIYEVKFDKEILNFAFILEKIKAINSYSNLILNLLIKQETSMNAFMSISDFFNNQSIIKISSYTSQEIEDLFQNEKTSLEKKKWYFQFVLDNLIESFENHFSEKLSHIINQIPKSKQKEINLFRKLLNQTTHLKANAERILLKINVMKNQIQSSRNWYKTIINKIQFVSSKESPYRGTCFAKSSLRELNPKEELSDFFYMLENHLALKSSLETVLRKRIMLLEGKFKLKKAINLLAVPLNNQDHSKINSIYEQINLIENSLNEDKTKNVELYKELFKTPYLLCQVFMDNKENFFIKRKFEELNRRVEINLSLKEQDHGERFINEHSPISWNREGNLHLNLGEIKNYGLKSNTPYELTLEFKDKDQSNWEFSSKNNIFFDESFYQKEKEQDSSLAVVYTLGPNPSSGDLFLMKSEINHKELKIRYTLTDEQGNRVCMNASSILFPVTQEVLNLEIKANCKIPAGKYFLRVINRIGREAKEVLIDNHLVIFD